MPKGIPSVQATCNVPGCNGTFRSRGMCFMHYQRWMKTGSTDAPRSPLDDGRAISEHVLDRFLAGIRKLESGCWNCDTAYQLSNGYSEVKIHNKASGLVRRRVHILSYEHFVGPVPEGMKVCHKCDNRPCCNPDHLFIGTQAENLADMARKDRSLFGEDRPQAKLTEGDVLSIYRLHATGMIQREIGERYGITQTAVGLIVRGKRWERLYRKQHGAATPCEQ